MGDCKHSKCISLFIYLQRPSTGAGCKTRSIFKSSLTKYPSPKPVAVPTLKNPHSSTIYPFLVVEKSYALIAQHFWRPTQGQLFYIELKMTLIAPVKHINDIAHAQNFNTLFFFHHLKLKEYAQIDQVNIGSSGLNFITVSEIQGKKYVSIRFYFWFWKEHCLDVWI